MDGARKKIRLYLLVTIGMIIIESLLGFSSLYSGILFSEYDRITAEENLVIIKETDPSHYQLLMDPEDPTYMDEFKRIHTKRGNRTLTTYGIILIVLSLGAAIPAALAFQETASGEAGTENKSEQDEESEKPGEDESF